MVLLLRLWYQPVAAMSEILDRGSLLFASIAVLVVTAAIKFNAPWLAAGVFMPLRGLLGMVASPFFLFFAWYYLGGEFSRLGDGLRARQNFHRMLQAAAVNPHDGEAQYQLGLIHQQRHQRTEAIQRFRAAIQID